MSRPSRRNSSRSRQSTYDGQSPSGYKDRPIKILPPGDRQTPSLWIDVPPFSLEKILPQIERIQNSLAKFRTNPADPQVDRIIYDGARELAHILDLRRQIGHPWPGIVYLGPFNEIITVNQATEGYLRLEGWI
jgi:hypothetical protein